MPPIKKLVLRILSRWGLRDCEATRGSRLPVVIDNCQQLPKKEGCLLRRNALLTRDAVMARLNALTQRRWILSMYADGVHFAVRGRTCLKPLPGRRTFMAPRMAENEW